MRNLTEDEKRMVNEAMRGPFWMIFEEFVKEKTESYQECSDTALGPDLSSILVREQWIGAAMHLKYLAVDFQNFVKTQNQKIHDHT